MKKDVAVPVKNIFSKAALRMLNACAKFVYHFSKGFGITFTEASGSIVVGIDVDNELFKEWLRVVTRESVKSQTEIDVSGQMANDYNENYDTPPITPATDSLWQQMTKDEKNSTDTQIYYKGYKENAVIAIEDNDGAHKFWWVEKEYTPDGRLKSVSNLKGMTMIGA